ncbi:MAG: dTDP-4-amino-4,6-dideoxygalactose transaminase [Ethanoligenens sp.]
MISFNVPPFVGKELDYIAEAVKSNRKISGDGPFTRKCSTWMEECFGVQRALLVTSGTHALEMTALLCDIRPGDEVIMPSYTFVSTANAFLMRGAVPVFVDIRPDTLNIDERLIEDAITEKTRAIVVVHYAGVACEMDTICAIAARHNLLVIEDAAHGFLARYKGRFLGTIGQFGAFSFHETKNYSMGEGGALLLNDRQQAARAEIIREKGTDRSRFFRGEVDKYTWVDIGSSYLPSDLNAAYLYAQLEQAQLIFQDRMRAWTFYRAALGDLAESGRIELPEVPPECSHNAHMFYLKCSDVEERTRLLAFLRENGIEAVFHYIPLHSSTAGRKYGRFHGDDRYTTKESERICRLPLYYGISAADQVAVVDAVHSFFAPAVAPGVRDKTWGARV